MGKTKRGEKEFSKEKQLIHENQKLKRTIATLRKQLARLDIDRYSQVREMIEEHYQDDKAKEGQDILDNLKKQWLCKECNVGHLEIVLFNKISDTFYFRKCSSCENRTKSQRYDSKTVQGIIKNKE